MEKLFFRVVAPLSLCFFYFIITPVHAYCNGEYFGGDWEVNQSVSCSDEYIKVNGSIVIKHGGNLTLSNVSMSFVPENGDAGIRNNGILNIYSSRINNSGEGNYYMNLSGEESKVYDTKITGVFWVVVESAAVDMKNVSLTSLSEINFTSTGYFYNSTFVCEGSCSYVMVSGSGYTFKGVTFKNYDIGIYGYRLHDSDIINVTVSDAAVSAFFEESSNVNVKNSTFLSRENSIVLKSSPEININDSEFSNITVLWALDVFVSGNDNPLENASVTIYDVFGNRVFEGLTDSYGSVHTYLPEFIYNGTNYTYFTPYSMNVTAENFEDNFTEFDITGDLSIEINMEGIQQPTPVPLMINLLSPTNKTYLKPDLPGGILTINVNSNINMSSCTYLLGSTSGSLDMVNPRNFKKEINVSDTLLFGITFLNVTCTSTQYYGSTTNSSSVWFTIYPAYSCLSNDDCPPNEFCEDYECTAVQCPCGEISNHECIAYECCSDEDCGNDEKCDLTQHQCVKVECECGIVQNHVCTKPPEWCCLDTDCKENEVCDIGTHKCKVQYLNVSIYGKLVEGNNITVMITDDEGNPVDHVKVTVTYEGGKRKIYYTDMEGNVNFKLESSGNVQVSTRKERYSAEQRVLKVEARFDPTWIILTLILIISGAGAFFFYIKKIRVAGPLELEKHVSSNTVMLRIKNRTNRVLRNITIIDEVPRGAFLGAEIMPVIEQGSGSMDYLKWEILELEPKEEVHILYQSTSYTQGFSARFEDKEFFSK